MPAYKLTLPETGEIGNCLNLEENLSKKVFSDTECQIKALNFLMPITNNWTHINDCINFSYNKSDYSFTDHFVKICIRDGWRLETIAAISSLALPLIGIFYRALVYRAYRPAAADIQDTANEPAEHTDSL